MASSSAAIVLPVVQSLRLTDTPVVQLMPQVAVADAACIIALPLAIAPGQAGRASLGVLAVTGAAVLVFLGFRALERSGERRRVHRWSEQHRMAVELRVCLAILFTLAFVATRTHVSVMLAGFLFGLAVGAVGEPRRLTKQLFAITDGFLGPLFFVWLGASLNLRDLGDHPRFIALGIVLGLAATLAHLVPRLTGQPVAAGLLGSAQLGVPVAAATLGQQFGLLEPGEAPALLLGALVTIGVATLGASLLARRNPAASRTP
jgi:Kef-type K+ transport system membrane component KefB